MIKAMELRSGNKIRSIFGRTETVRMILGHETYKDRKDIHEIYKHVIGVEENGNQYNLGEINPVPWSLSLQKLVWPFEYGIGPLRMINNEKVYWQVNWDGASLIYKHQEEDAILRLPQITGLHVFQNQFFFLTQQEALLPDLPLYV
jgi:hypothetical protein